MKRFTMMFFCGPILLADIRRTLVEGNTNEFNQKGKTGYYKLDLETYVYHHCRCSASLKDNSTIGRNFKFDQLYPSLKNIFARICSYSFWSKQSNLNNVLKNEFTNKNKTSTIYILFINISTSYYLSILSELWWLDRSLSNR